MTVPSDSEPLSGYEADQERVDAGSRRASESSERMAAGRIARTSARGGLLLAARNGVVQLVQVASTLLIAHFVVPAAYGALTIALAALGFARYAGDLGVANSFLAVPALDDDVRETGAFVALMLAVCETAALLALAPILASALHGPAYTADIIRVLAVCLTLEALRFGPMVTLNRELRFARYGALVLAETLMLYMSQIGLLLAGLGVWALVIGQLVRSAGGTIVYLWFGGGATRPARRVSVLPLLRRALPFQGPAVLAGLSGLLFPLVLTIALTARGIGFWGWATVLATPIAAIVTVVSGVSLPTLARMRRDDPAQVSRAVDIMIRASVLAPAAGAGALIGFAHPLITRLFGARWHPALGAVELNLIGVLPVTLSFFLAAVLESAQRARERFLAVLASQLLGLACVPFVATRFGVSGAAFVSAIAVPVVDVLILGFMSGIGYGRATRGGVIAFSLAAAVSFALARLVTSDLTLALCVAAAGLSLAPIVWASDRTAVRAVLRFGVPMPDRVAIWLRVTGPGAGS